MLIGAADQQGLYRQRAVRRARPSTAACILTTGSAAPRAGAERQRRGLRDRPAPAPTPTWRCCRAARPSTGTSCSSTSGRPPAASSSPSSSPPRNTTRASAAASATCSPSWSTASTSRCCRPETGCRSTPSTAATPTARRPASTATLYVNNNADDGGPRFDLQYDGFTRRLGAVGVRPGRRPAHPQDRHRRRGRRRARLGGLHPARRHQRRGAAGGDAEPAPLACSGRRWAACSPAGTGTVRPGAALRERDRAAPGSPRRACRRAPAAALSRDAAPRPGRRFRARAAARPARARRCAAAAAAPAGAAPAMGPAARPGA